ncbi:cysteine-rich motor neuron 1 protein-like [Diadema setosum]|uniref:cysteine-rich motor neuron 1 protein-like n=1 Tax=Diadema setosum TaxID=31175 RepID=UPI003B3BA630
MARKILPEMSWKLSLLEITVLLLAQNIISCAAMRESLSSSSDSSSKGFSSYEPLLPCVYSGMPYLHGESWKLDECTTCSCDNATATCVVEPCWPAFCTDPIRPEGECCSICPDENETVVKRSACQELAADPLNENRSGCKTEEPRIGTTSNANTSPVITLSVAVGSSIAVLLLW